MTNLHSEVNPSFDFYQNKQMGGYAGLVAYNYRFQIDHLSQLRDSSWTPKVIDIGAGLGDGLLLFRQQWPDAQCFTVDLALASAIGAQRRGLLPVLASAEGCALPFRDQSVDVIVMNEIIEHLVDTDSILDEVKRILVPGGVLLMSTPNLAAWFNRLALLMGLQPAFSEVSMRKVYGRPGSDLVGHLRLFTSRAFTEMLRDKGFVLTKVGGAPFGSLPKWLRPFDRFVTRKVSLASLTVIVAEI
jgi:ubiquinone/menaquinone biosynthesis C-methylase UbiE